MHPIGTNLLWTARPPIDGASILPDKAFCPRVRVWDAACGLPSPGSNDEKVALKTIAFLKQHGYKGFYQVGKHGQHSIDSVQFGHICDFIEAHSDVIIAMSGWNEPNNTPDAGMTVDALGALYGEARKHLKNVKLAGPSSEGFGGINYFSQFLYKYGGLIDIADHHFYLRHPSDLNLNGVTTKVQAYKKIVPTGKPFWVGEYGFDFRDANNIPVPHGSVVNPQAEQLIHAFTWQLINAGVETPFWWNGDSTDQPTVLVQSGRQALTAEGQSWMKVMAGIQHGQ